MRLRKSETESHYLLKFLKQDRTHNTVGKQVSNCYFWGFLELFQFLAYDEFLVFGLFSSWLWGLFSVMLDSNNLFSLQWTLVLLYYMGRTSFRLHRMGDYIKAQSNLNKTKNMIHLRFCTGYLLLILVQLAHMGINYMPGTKYFKYSNSFKYHNCPMK